MCCSDVIKKGGKMEIKIGDIFESNNYGKFKILNSVKKKSYEIEFIDTGYKTVVTHNKILKKSITDKSLRKCCICGRDDNGIYISKKFNAILCSDCYKQAKNRNSLEKVGQATIFDKNEIVRYEDYAEIIIKNKNQIEIARAIIDIEDVEKCENIKWRLCSTRVRGVVFNNIGFELHKYITNVKDSIVDHIDRNPLNNRKSNLRKATPQQNSINSSLSKNNTTGFIGVWEQKSLNKNKWCAELMLNRKKVFREYFETKEEAIVARLKAELKYFGKEFAPQRHLFEEYGILPI
jgi:hypothetical protein